MPGLWDGLVDTAEDTYDEVAGAGEDAYDYAAGAGDYWAGGFDESIGRQFDDEAGGGFADWDTWVDNEDPGWLGDTAEWWTETATGMEPGSFDEWVGDDPLDNTWDTVAGVGDDLAGSTDEWVGGGVDDTVNDTENALDDALGGLGNAVQNTVNLGEGISDALIGLVIVVAIAYVLANTDGEAGGA